MESDDWSEGSDDQSEGSEWLMLIANVDAMLNANVEMKCLSVYNKSESWAKRYFEEDCRKNEFVRN